MNNYEHNQSERSVEPSHELSLATVESKFTEDNTFHTDQVEEES